MHSAIIKMFCVFFALYCSWWYLVNYEPELYDQMQNWFLQSELKQDSQKYSQQSSTQQDLVQLPEVTTTPNIVASIPPMSWLFTEDFYDASLSMPHTRVQLKVGCPVGAPRACTERIIDAGVFSGACTVIEHPQDTEELTGVLCWFAGAGDEIGVYQNGDHLELRKGEQQEGGADYAGYRGNFTQLEVIQ